MPPQQQKLKNTTETSPSNCLLSYPGHWLKGRESYLTVEKQSVYSTTPANWATWPSDCLMSYPGHLLRGKVEFYPSAEMQSAYSKTPAKRSS